MILSGMGSDGTLGLRAIKEKAGAVFVQSPASAKFDGMPRSAIDAGLADVDRAGRRAGREARRLSRTTFRPHRPGQGRRSRRRSKSALEKIVILLRAQTGHDFAQYKKATIYRRIERRMGLHQLARITDYVRYLRENPQEAESALQGALDRRHELLPRSRGMGPAARRGPAGAARVSPGRAGAPRVDRRLLDGRGSVFPRDRLQGGAREAQAGQERGAASLRDRSRQGRHRQGAAGYLSGQHRRRRLGETPRAVLRPG